MSDWNRQSNYVNISDLTLTFKRLAKFGNFARILMAFLKFSFKLSLIYANTRMIDKDLFHVRIITINFFVRSSK